MEKEYKVRLHHVDSGYCIEIWESKPDDGKKPVYFGRETEGLNAWYYVCDAPYGYCEKESPVNHDTEFIVCDQQWNEVLRDANARKYEGFPTLETACREAWCTILGQYPNCKREGFQKWILDKMPSDVDYTDKINWDSFRQEIISKDKIGEFTWLGVNYHIIRLMVKHTICGEMWYEYFAERDGRDEYENYARFYGYEYSDEHSQQLQESITA